MAKKRPAGSRGQNARRNLARTPARSATAPKDTGTLDLALRILDHLAEQASPIALTAIAQTFSASKSTVYRHLSALARHGFARVSYCPLGGGEPSAAMREVIAGLAEQGVRVEADGAPLEKLGFV